MYECLFLVTCWRTRSKVDLRVVSSLTRVSGLFKCFFFSPTTVFKLISNSQHLLDDLFSPLMGQYLAITHPPFQAIQSGVSRQSGMCSAPLVAKIIE